MFMQHATDSGNIPFNSAVLDILLRVLDAADITVIQICRLKWWLGAELNRRHKDFQSSALPTELPSQTIANKELSCSKTVSRFRIAYRHCIP